MTMLDYFKRHRGDTRGRLMLATIALAIGLLAGWGVGSLRHDKRPLSSSLTSTKPVRHGDLGLVDQIKIEIWKRFSSRGTIVMVGDSHTDLADWGAIFPDANIVNRGV